MQEQQQNHQQQHAPAFVHATVYLRQNDPDFPQALSLWKSLFNRWEEIFSFSSSSSNNNLHHDNSSEENSRSSNYNNNYLYDFDEDDDDDDYAPTNHNMDGNDEDDDERSNRFSNYNHNNEDFYQHHQPPPPPGAILLRLLLSAGCVVPGTLNQCCPGFNQQRYSSSSGLSSQVVVDLNPHHMMNASSNAQLNQQQIFQQAETRLRQDDSLAALAYAEWWQWVLQHTSTSAAAGSFSKAKGSIFSSSSSKNTTASSTVSSISTSKFLFAAAVKIGCLLQFVSISGLQKIVKCTKMTLTSVTRAQAALVATLTKLPAVTPLPPPFLLAHLPQLRGATGEAFMDVLHDDDENDFQNDDGEESSSSVDFFSFSVQRAISILPVNFGSSSAILHKENEVGLELKFLDQIHQQDLMNNENTGARRGRDEQISAKGNLSGNNSNNSQQQQQQSHINPNNNNIQLFTPKWSYGCLRFTSLLPRTVSIMMLNTTGNNNTSSTNNNNTAASFSGAVSAMICKEPLHGGLLRFPQYEEVFGIRFVILLAQRMLTFSLKYRQSSQTQQLLRLASRLAFWASTAAASFPMEISTVSNTRGGLNSMLMNNNISRGSRNNNPLLSQNTNNTTKKKKDQQNNEKKFHFNMLLSLEGLNELVTIPCMSASLALYCSLAQISSNNNSSNETTSKNNNSNNVIVSSSNGGAAEALLSVALAYAACTFAAKSASTKTATTMNGQNNTASYSRKEAAIANLMKQRQEEVTNTKKTRDDHQLHHHSQKTEKVMTELEEEIKIWTSMNPKERSALSLRFLLLSLTSQWIACYPQKQLQTDVPKHVIASLPEELKVVLECKFNPALLNLVLGLDDGANKDASSAASPKFFSFNAAMQMKKMQQQQQMQQQQEDAAGVASKALDFGDDDDDATTQESASQKQTMHELLLLWGSLESCANEEILF